MDEAELVDKWAAGEPTPVLKCPTTSWLSSSSFSSLAGCEASGDSIVRVGGVRAHSLDGYSGDDADGDAGGETGELTVSIFLFPS